MTARSVRLAYVLLGLMTLTCFGGPFLLGQALRGGESPAWPPDRPIEWAVFLGMTGVILAILALLAALWAASHRQMAAIRDSARARRAGSEASPDRAEP